MTEADWLTSTDVRKLTKHLPQPLSRRKCVLAVSGYGRRIERFIPLLPVIAYLDQAEQGADGRATLETGVDQFNLRFRPVEHGLIVNTAPCTICYAMLWSLYTAAEERPYIGPANYQALRAAVAHLQRPDPAFSFNPREHSKEWVRLYDVEAAAQADIVRDVFGNPFRPVTFSPEWRTDTAIAIAQQMYDSRDFGAMPILADALQDAGCDNDDILSHCRGPGQHVRGCWVVDLVLGEE